jgi:hypothetical protein
MISVASVRKGLKNLSLVGLTVVAVVSAAIAAVPGFPFTEDFANNALEGTGSTADWGTTAPGTLQMGFDNNLTAMTLTRSPLGGIAEPSRRSRDVALGDVDGDGDIDAAVAVEGDANLIYFNNAGVFSTAPVEIDAADNRRSVGIQMGDLNNDGHLDIAACNFQGVGVYYLNDGFGNFSAAVPFTSETRRSWRCELIDVDGDSDLDYIEVNSGGENALYRNLLVESGNGTLSFSAEDRITADLFATRSVAFGDIDNDGDTDMIAGDQGAANHIYRWFNGDFVARDIVHDNTNLTFSLALADIDGDGYVDLVEGNTAIPTQIYLNQGALNPGFFSAPVALADSNPLHQALGLVLRDFDRDGDIDILEANNGVWDDDGDTGVTPTCLDVVAPLTPCLPQPVRLYLNNGNGTFANGLTFEPAEVQKVYGIAAGDIDQDGRLDFVTAHSSLNEGGPPALSTNAVYMNGGATGAGNVRQLDSLAVSATQVGSGVAVPHARLTVTPSPQAAQAQITWYLSNDAGNTFIRTTPGVPIAFPNPNGSQLMWKAEMLQNSPATAQAVLVNEVNIADNGRPNFSNQGDLAGVEGQNFLSTLSLYFTDPDGDALSYQISGLPAGTGLSLDAQTGVLSGVPTNDDAVNSPVALTISAFDGAESRSGNISMTVTNAVNDPPTANDDGPYVIDEGGAIASTFNVLDNDTDPDTANLNAVLVDPPSDSALFELKPDGTFDYTHNGSETTSDSFTYRADDGGSQSNVATVSITINPVNDAPTLTVNGAATVNIVVGDAYADAGATADDAEDGDISADIVVGGDVVDTDTAGTYVITYDVTDSGGTPAAQVSRTVNVATNNPPVITLNGSASITLTVGDAFTDAGATAMDDEDGDITANIVVGGDAVNTAAAGTYTITYNVTDNDGNAATEVTRTVTVNNPPPPPPPPKKKSGGGAAGLLELFGLMAAGLVTIRRRRGRKFLA